MQEVTEMTNNLLNFLHEAFTFINKQPYFYSKIITVSPTSPSPPYSSGGR